MSTYEEIELAQRVMENESRRRRHIAPARRKRREPIPEVERYNPGADNFSGMKLHLCESLKAVIKSRHE